MAKRESPSGMLTIRSYNSSDAAELLTLFRRTIREINSADYGADQIRAWASNDIDAQQWQDRFTDRLAYVAEFDSEIAGFVDMTTEGYLDRLFVSADHQRCGIGRQLVTKLLRDANEHGIGMIFTDASITARPFFEASGFTVLEQQTVQCRGVDFVNYRMQRNID